MKFAAVSILALCLAVPGAALADPGNGKGHDKGHGKDKHPAAYAHPGTPPGLAKKPHGMPPGQAKKMWRKGEYLPSQYYTQSRYYVTNPSAYNLAPAPYGSRWVRVDDRYYLTQTKTGAILQLAAILAR
jgi:Ni/Co efflux regulator RcnB